MKSHQQPELIQDSIIGCLFNWPQEIDTAAAILVPDDFFSREHREAFIWALANREEGFDLVTLSNALQGKVDVATLAEWTTSDAIPSMLPRYCRDLKDAANRRRIFDLASDVRTMCGQQKPYPEIREHLDSQLSQIGNRQRTSTMKTARELVLSTVKRLEERYERKGALQGIPYGWPEVDQATNGMHRGELIIVAGRPSMGKSAFAGNVLTSAARNGFRGVLFNLEMGQGETMDRLTAAEGNIHLGRIRSGEFEGADWDRMVRACSKLAELPLAIDDTPGLSLSDLRSRCRKLKGEPGLDLIIVDYLQLMKTPQRENRVQALGEISRGLKLLARELDVAVMALSQLNRGVDSRQDKRPTMSDLRDSGEIEQDADVILFPFREAAYCERCRNRKDDADHNTSHHQAVAELIIEKQRNGERNVSIPLIWRGYFQRFDAPRGN